MRLRFVFLLLRDKKIAQEHELHEEHDHDDHSTKEQDDEIGWGWARHE